MTRQKIEVLILEPDAILASTYTKALHARGFGVSHESEAGAAIVSLDNQQPKVIVLELQLKGNNGIEFLHELRSYTDWRAIPVVVNSIIPENESGLSLQTMKQLYVTDYCYKPRTKLPHLVNIIEGLAIRI